MGWSNTHHETRDVRMKSSVNHCTIAHRKAHDSILEIRKPAATYGLVDKSKSHDENAILQTSTMLSATGPTLAVALKKSGRTEDIGTQSE